MSYRFIRTGNRPVDDGNNPEWQIRLCFEHCKPEVKKELDKFLGDAMRESVTFDFGDNKVTVTRE
jgi:hypothetical protein